MITRADKRFVISILRDALANGCLISVYETGWPLVDRTDDLVFLITALFRGREDHILIHPPRGLEGRMHFVYDASLPYPVAQYHPSVDGFIQRAVAGCAIIN